MANISYIKGVRTRYLNILKKEINHGESLLLEDLDNVDPSEFQNGIDMCLEKLKLYDEKLQDQSSKLANLLDDSDESFVEQIVGEDSEISEESFKLCFNLQRVSDEIKGKELKATTYVKKEEESLQLQQGLQQVFENQMQLQADFFAKQKEYRERQSTSVKLPKLDVISFNGNKLQWIEFWDAFESAIHKNKSLSNIDKFNYLKSKLIGEAKCAIAGLTLSNENYSVAISILHERFGNRQEVIDLHYNALIDLTPARNTTESLRHMLDKIEKHLRCLEVLHQDTNQDVFVSLVRKKLPSDVLLQLEILHGSGKEWRVQSLRDHLRQYIVAREKTEKVKFPETASTKFQTPGPKYPPFNSYRNDKKPQQKFASEAFVANTRNATSKGPMKQCRYCKNNHWSDECQRYKSIEDRQKQLRGSCFKCLREGHMSSDCKTSRACVYCGQTNVHHRSLCPKQFKRKIVRESVQFSEQEEQSARVNFIKDENMLLSSEETVLMQTAVTEIKHPECSSSAQVRLLMDSGSQRSYITEQLARKLGLQEENEQEIRLVTFGSDKTKVIKTRSTKLDIKLSNGDYKTMDVNIVPNITGTIVRRPVVLAEREHFFEHTQNMKLADTVPNVSESDTVELLIGNDYYLDFILPEKIEVQSGLYLLASRLGWILTGRTPTSDSRDMQDVSMLIMTHGSQLSNTEVFCGVDSCIPTKPDLEDFWNVETIGITKCNNENPEDIKAMDKFKSTIKFEEGRYQVTWPWKDDDPDLPENRGLAIGRLRSLSLKLRRQPEMLEKYDAIIQDQLQKGMIEKVDRNVADGIKHYIPHHAVINPQRSTTKVRIVYDASAKTRSENKSLNESLYRGPVLLHDLCGILMRFRLHNIGIVADIEKAFLQVGLQRTERDVTRFLWFKDKENPYVDEDHIQEFRFCRVPFGVISSPFLLGATIENHLDTYQDPLTEKLKKNIYMDNIITGTNTENEAKELYKNAKGMFSDANMNLREWKTSSTTVNTKIPECDLVKDKNIKVLGHVWHTEKDTLTLKKVPTQDEDTILTKRTVLKQIASAYDPLGLVSPVTLRGKILLQKLWSEHIDWDEEIGETFIQEWNDVKLDLKDINTVEFSRSINMPNAANEVSYSLICFCDASSKAYAASIYLLQRSAAENKVDLLFSKVRLAPVKGMTIPKLELMAVLIGVRSVEFVKTQLQLDLKQMVLATDSQCVLQWITSEKSLPVFVQNRVKEIRSHGDITFYYVNTKENPADLASRGCDLKFLRGSDIWWHGPQWLLQPMESWPLMSYTTSQQPHDSVNECSIQVEELVDVNIVESSKLSCNSTIPEFRESELKRDEQCLSAPFGMDINRYSSLTRLLRVTAWCNRFVKGLKKQNTENVSLTSDEVEEAQVYWIKYIQHKYFPDVFSSLSGNTKKHNLVTQLGLFEDGSGLLKCRGRLENADLCEASRTPILLPSSDKFTHLVIEHIHKQLLHSGISQTLCKARCKFWITRGRATVRKVLKSCLICRKIEGGPYKMPSMAPLPKSRVSECIPFSHTGIDYLGPLYTKDNNDVNKIWVCLFTCMVTRAIHLEVIQDMSTKAFLNCLRRFIATRGTPTQIVCDNAMHFKLASETIKLVWSDIVKAEDVQNYCSSEGIQWNFIVELAPWMGGFYERLVGIVKRSLRKTIGRKILNSDQFITVLKEAESVVNSRPLVYIGEDINSSIAITPANFLCLNPKIGIPETEMSADPDYKPNESSAEKLLKIWRKGEQLLNSFWNIWRGEYLLSLRERYQNKLRGGRVQSEFSPKVGDIVLIKDDIPRCSWRFGKIVRLRKSSDGQIRSADLNTHSGRKLTRPLNLLYPVETSEKSPTSDITIKPEVCKPRERLPTRAASERARQKIKSQI